MKEIKHIDQGNINSINSRDQRIMIKEKLRKVRRFFFRKLLSEIKWKTSGIK